MTNSVFLAEIFLITGTFTTSSPDRQIQRSEAKFSGELLLRLTSGRTEVQR